MIFIVAFAKKAHSFLNFKKKEGEAIYRVLLVEDEAGVRERIAKIIAWQEHGFGLEGCLENGKQALELQRNQPADLIITDINMPVMNGLDLSREIYENWPETQIVIVSGFDDFNYAQQAIKYKVYDYLLKPVTAKQLRGLLDNLKIELDTKKLQQGRPNEVFEEILSGRISNPEVNTLVGESPFSVAILEVLVEETSGISHQLDFRRILEKKINDPRKIIRDDSGRLVVFCSGENPTEKLKEIIIEVREEAGAQISSIICDKVENIQEIASIYTQMLENWGQLYRISAENVVNLRELTKTKEKTPLMSGFRRQVIQGIRVIDQGRTQKAVKNFVGQLTNSSYQKAEIINQIKKLLILMNEYSDEQNLTFPQRAFEQLDALPNLKKAQMLLSQIAENILSQSKHQGDSSSRQGLLATEYIKENYNKPDLALKHITDYLSVSTSHFCIIFKNHTGTTFLEFLTRIRMNKAQELIITTDMKSYEIAEKVGYDDPGYFRSVFKKFTGTSPSQFRKRNGI